MSIDTAIHISFMTDCLQKVKFIAAMRKFCFCQSHYIFFVTIRKNSPVSVFQTERQCIDTVSHTENDSCCTFRRKTSQFYGYRIFPPLFFSCFQSWKYSVRPVFFDPHRFHIMNPLIFGNNPGGARTIIGIIADRIIPDSSVPLFYNIMIFTGSSMISVIRKFTNRKIVKVFLSQYYISFHCISPSVKWIPVHLPETGCHAIHLYLLHTKASFHPN